MEQWLNRPLVEILQILQQRSLHETKWFGVGAIKCPMDFWVYQEIIYTQQPDFIIEIGNYKGGSTLALAHLCDLNNHGNIIALDINHELIPQKVKIHPRIKFITGDACENFSQVQKIVESSKKILIIEDSSHTYKNTLNVLNTFSTLLSSGNYFIVEDTSCHHGVNDGPSPGPYEAVKEFLRANHDFISDQTKESFVITWNPGGFLLKK